MIRALVSLTSAFVVFAIAGSGSAVPCGPTTCAPLSSSVAGSRVLLVRPHGQTGPLVTYDLATGRVVANLPEGVASADGRRYVATSNGVQSTRVTRYDPRTGARL